MTTETTAHTSSHMNSRLIATAADVISRAMQKGRTLPAALAVALDSAQLLQSPETAAELEHYRSAFEAQQARAETLDRLLRTAQDRVAELEAAPTTVYRAEHPDSGITLGHYGTEAAARAHCEATERRAWPAGTTLVFDWIEDDEDRVAELVVTAGQNEESTTGYIVTALELDSEYDPDGDE